jgi:hypothetical protein
MIFLAKLYHVQSLRVRRALRKKAIFVAEEEFYD